MSIDSAWSPETAENVLSEASAMPFVTALPARASDVATREAVARSSRLYLGLQRLDDDEPLIDSGIVDSLGVLRILAFLDETLGIDLSSSEIKLENFKTVRTICELIERGGTS
jgi:acyl carrier protein